MNLTIHEICLVTNQGDIPVRVKSPIHFLPSDTLTATFEHPVRDKFREGTDWVLEAPRPPVDIADVPLVEYAKAKWRKWVR